MSILVFGALHWDVVVDAPRLPGLGETLAGTSVDYRFGGKGGNQAVAAARLGAPVRMIGRVGQDAPADRIIETLRAAGVDDARVQSVAAPTGMSVAITDSEGDYGAVIVSGANLSNDGDAAIPLDTTICCLQNEVPEAANARLAAALPGSARLILNAAPARPVAHALLERTDILVLNETEALQMADCTDPGRAATLLAADGRSVIVTLGSDGALLAGDGDLGRFPAYPVEAVSAHGAGDMFIGALAASLEGGSTLAGAVAFAQAAAALFVSSAIGDRARIGRADVLRFQDGSTP